MVGIILYTNMYSGRIWFLHLLLPYVGGISWLIGYRRMRTAGKILWNLILPYEFRPRRMLYQRTSLISCSAVRAAISMSLFAEKPTTWKKLSDIAFGQLRKPDNGTIVGLSKGVESESMNSWQWSFIYCPPWSVSEQRSLYDSYVDIVVLVIWI